MWKPSGSFLNNSILNPDPNKRRVTNDLPNAMLPKYSYIQPGIASWSLESLPADAHMIRNRSVVNYQLTVNSLANIL